MNTEIEQFILKRKAKSPKAWAGFEAKYRSYAIGMLLAEYREKAGVSLTQLAKLANMQKTALSRLENHGEDVRFSTIVRYVEATGKPMLFRISPATVSSKSAKSKRTGAKVELQLQPA